ncbi:MAG: hypothetical protein AAF151_15520 [Cyanobacteria bacterium J06656_5]
MASAQHVQPQSLHTPWQVRSAMGQGCDRTRRALPDGIHRQTIPISHGFMT